MTKVKAFSLIELLVVITIIAIIAAVAVPSYQTFIMRSKINSAVQIMNSYNEKYKILFPTANNNVGEQVDNQYVSTLPDNPSPYLAFLRTTLQVQNDTECGNVVTLAFITNYAAGGNAFVTGNGYITYLYLQDAAHNGQFVRFCWGYTLDPNEPIIGLLPEGCYDIQDPAQRAAFNAVVNNFNASSTCDTDVTTQ